MASQRAVRRRNASSRPPSARCHNRTTFANTCSGSAPTPTTSAHPTTRKTQSGFSPGSRNGGSRPQSNRSRSSFPRQKYACSKCSNRSPSPRGSRKRLWLSTRPPDKSPNNCPPTMPTRLMGMSPALWSMSITACPTITGNSSGWACRSKGPSSSPNTGNPGGASSPRSPPNTAPSVACFTRTPKRTATGWMTFFPTGRCAIPVASSAAVSWTFRPPARATR